jgi:hypothetical protein
VKAWKRGEGLERKDKDLEEKMKAWRERMGK